MPFMPSPIVLLGGLIAAIGIFLSGFFYGGSYQKGKQAINVVTVQNQALNDANRDVEAEQQRAVAAAKQEAERRASFQIIKLKGERDALLKAKPDCSRDSDSMRLLNDAINSANGQEATPTELSLRMPASLFTSR